MGLVTLWTTALNLWRTAVPAVPGGSAILCHGSRRFPPIMVPAAHGVATVPAGSAIMGAHYIRNRARARSLLRRQGRREPLTPPLWSARFPPARHSPGNQISEGASRWA